MSTYSLVHVSDAALARDLAAAAARDRASTAVLLAHIAEFDARKLYLPAAYPSMYLYCVGELRLSEDAAYKRIQAARVARQFPAIFEAVSAGRLHLAAVCMLAPHLTPDNAAELLAAATYQSKAGIERLLAERFSRPDLPTRIEAVLPPPAAQPSPASQHAPRSAEHLLRDPAEPLGPSEQQLAPGQVAPPCSPPRLAPLAPERFALQVTISQETHDKLRRAQALLGHTLPSGDLAQVLDRALDLLIDRLERRKFAAARRPSTSKRSSANPRHIPAHVKRAVQARDQGQCTFVSDSGRRCPARTRLEFDHVEPVARGGQATVAGVRLRCRAHNQYDAECAFGAGFMQRKREQAREMAAQWRSSKAGP